MMTETDVSLPCDDCYLRKDCDEVTESTCKFNDFCKYVPESPDRKTVTPDWYEFKINELQDWLLDKQIHAGAPDIACAYKEVLHRVIDMFEGANTDWDEVIERMYEWS